MLKVHVNKCNRENLLQELAVRDLIAHREIMERAECRNTNGHHRQQGVLKAHVSKCNRGNHPREAATLVLIAQREAAVVILATVEAVERVEEEIRPVEEANKLFIN